MMEMVFFCGLLLLVSSSCKIYVCDVGFQSYLCSCSIFLAFHPVRLGWCLLGENHVNSCFSFFSSRFGSLVPRSCMCLDKI